MIILVDMSGSVTPVGTMVVAGSIEFPEMEFVVTDLDDGEVQIEEVPPP